MLAVPLPKFPAGKACVFCSQSRVDTLSLGDVYRFGHTATLVHYYCLLFATRLPQNGDDSQGVLGFLHADVRTELKRVKKKKCFYCGCSGPTVKCRDEKCSKIFHLPCGLMHNSLHEFTGQFRSYCVEHRKKPPAQLSRLKFDEYCALCLEFISVGDSYQCFWAPCCHPPTLIHLKCLQKSAINAGYFFKCPFCNDSEKFVLAALKSGVHVPQRAATWEDESYYGEQYMSCSAERCLHPNDRQHTVDGTKWEFITCYFCGGDYIHWCCFKEKASSTAMPKKWACSACDLTSYQPNLCKKTLKRQREGSSESDRFRSRSQISWSRDICVYPFGMQKPSISLKKDIGRGVNDNASNLDISLLPMNKETLKELLIRYQTVRGILEQYLY